MRARLPNLPPPRDAYLPFDGGLDLETPPWEVKPGFLLESQNYERSVRGGYADIQGYERFDGQARPSDAGYTTLAFTLTGAIIVGDAVTGGTSGATAVVAAVETDLLVLTKVVGTFVDTEDIEVSAVSQGTAAGAPVADGGATQQLHAQYINAAADIYRADITAVPGEGSVLGVYMLNDVKYAFRNAVGGATAKMYKSTGAGWVEIDLGFELAYTSGSIQIPIGVVITGAISGATATVTGITVESGDWGTGDAAGRIIFASQTGTFVAEDLDFPSNANAASIAADSSAITQLPGGSYEFYRSNFASGSTAERMYGVDGINRGFEFDGTTFVPIATGMTDDTPDHVVVHRSHLFFTFGPSLQNSALGEPYNWTVIEGAGEVRTDGDITGLHREPGAQGNASLGVYNRHRLYMVYGTSTADFELVPYRDEVGAFAGTIQQVAFTLFLDDRGFTSLRTSQDFGNFNHATISTHIQQLVDATLSLATASCISRSKNQYRLFNSDGSGLYITFEGNKAAAMMPVLFNHSPTCAMSLETNGGTEEMYFGATDGFVYQMDKGTSFDGGNIEAYFRTHYSNDKIRHTKKFLAPVTIESRGTGWAEIEFGYELGYADSEMIPQASTQQAEIAFATAGTWDQPGLLWDTLFWDGRSLVPTTGLQLKGTAENVCFVVRKDSDYSQPVRMTGIHYRYVPRRGMR